MQSCIYVFMYVLYQNYASMIIRKPSCAEGREFESESSQMNELLNLFLLLPSLSLSINRTGDDLVSTISE